MNKTKYFLITCILLLSLTFRLFINYFLPINQQINWLMIFFGLINLLLLFDISRRLRNYEVGFISAFLYAFSPWTAYLELFSSPYIILLTTVLVIFLATKILGINKKISFLVAIFIILGFLYKFDQIKIFSNVGLVNAVNTFRGETNQTLFAPIGKIIENRYIYFSEHLVFNILKQFTPATYFTNQASLLGFSFSPPIYLGFIVPLLFELARLIKSTPKNKILKGIPLIFLMLPSILSNNSPDLSRLVIFSPVIFFAISNGLYELIISYKKRMIFFLLFLTLFMVGLQFLVTLSDIATRESIRLQMFRGLK